MDSGHPDVLAAVACAPIYVQLFQIGDAAQLQNLRFLPIHSTQPSLPFHIQSQNHGILKRGPSEVFLAFTSLAENEANSLSQRAVLRV